MDSPQCEGAMTNKRWAPIKEAGASNLAESLHAAG